jgi:peptide/nickel transport system substrate-binding protein
MINKYIFTYSLLFCLSLLTCLSCEPSGKTAKKAHSNRLTIRLEAAVDKINPLLKSTAYPRYVAANVFQTLGAYEPKTVELLPLMIKSIPESYAVKDGPFKGLQAYDFEIRDEAKWDNGTPITAADVEFSYKLVLNPSINNVFASYLELLKDMSIDATSPKKFTVYQKNYYFLAIEALCQMPIYPKYHYDPKGLMDHVKLADLADPKKRELLSKQDKGIQGHALFFQDAAFNSNKSTIVGSGPYRVDFIDPAQGVILVRKKDWWGNGLATTIPSFGAYPDTIHYKLVVAEDAAINMLRSGELDIMGGIKPDNFKKLEKDPDLAANYNFNLQWAPIYNRIMINNTDPILSDKRVRQALAYAINYNEMLQDIQLGMAQTTVSIVFPNHTSYAKEIEPYAFNAGKAKTLLAEAGWADTDNDGVADKLMNGKKTPLVLQLMNSTGIGTSDMISASLQTSMAKAGIKIDLKPMDVNKIAIETAAGNFQLAANAASTQPGEVDMTQNYHSKSLAPKGDNRIRYANKDVDNIIDKMRITPNKEERYQLSKEAQTIVHNDAAELFLYAPGFRIITSKAFDCTLSAMRPGYVDVLAKLKK